MKVRLDTAQVEALADGTFQVSAAADMSDDYVWVATFRTRQMAEDYAYLRAMPIHYELNEECSK